MGEIIKLENGQLRVPDYPTIPFIKGDGIGPEIWAAAQPVFDAAVKKVYGGTRRITWQPVLAGQAAFEQTGNWLPDATLAALKRYLVAIKGPLTTPVGGGHRSINVTLRQELDLYACVRPVRYYPGSPSPVRYPERVKMTLFRENTEDIYAGIEMGVGTEAAKGLTALLKEQRQLAKVRFPATSAYSIKPVSKEGTTRLVRAAIEYALRNNELTLTLVHKGNIMKQTEGAFKNWGYQVAEEYGDRLFTMAQYQALAKTSQHQADQALQGARAQKKLIVNDVICDNFLQQSLLHPENFAVIATLNLNGDYLSDALAAQVGGIGIAPSANINYQTGQALFEATHGTAPQFVGQNKMNPTSLLLSGAMMFDYLGWEAVGDLIRQGIAQAIASQHVTADLATSTAANVLSTSSFGNYLVSHL